MTVSAKPIKKKQFATNVTENSITTISIINCRKKNPKLGSHKPLSEL